MLVGGLELRNDNISFCSFAIMATLDFLVKPKLITVLVFLLLFFFFKICIIKYRTVYKM